jgi:nucleoside-diphosphate-sugar epimerase
MAILVIGGTGFIGPRAIRRLIERGEEVVCMDINPHSDQLSGMGERLKVMYGDVTSFEDVVKAILETKPDRIINLAYLLPVVGTEDRPHFDTRLNIMGMDNCFEAARVCGVNRVVYASSIAVSGQQSNFGDREVNEDDPMYGTSQYAMHKIFNEFQASKYIENYGMAITGIRPANVTGPDKFRGSVDHVRCITQPARGEPVSFPHKEIMRLPIHVEDIAEAFVRVLLADSSHYPVYNSGGHAISLGGLAEMVKEFLPDSQITFDNEGGRELSGNYMVDNSRLRDEFEIEYAPFRQRVLEIINEVRMDSGLPMVTGR